MACLESLPCSKSTCMSKCQFSIPFTGSADAVYNKAKATVEKGGGSFSGNTEAGSFSLQLFGTIAGNYRVVGNNLEITIEEKPMMIGCGMIESALKSQLG